MSNADPRGKFVWHELLTSDTAGAGAFYPKVVSWKTQPWERDPSYTLWMGKGGPVGGVASLEDSGSPRWLPYVAVEDVHAAVAQAKSMGAKVVKDVTDMPETGTYAVLTDPQGAEIAVYKSKNPSNSSGAPGVGEFSWHELSTSDAEGAVSFYSKLFGWEIGPKHDMGPEFGTYHLMLHNGEQFVGIFQSTAMPVSWMCYVRVDDAGKAANAAKSAGGRVINGPMEVPGGSWIAQILDPAGVGFAVHEHRMDAAGAAKPDAAAKPDSGAKPASKPKQPKAAKPAAEKPAATAPAAEKAAAKPEAAPKADTSKPAAKPAASKPAAAKPAAKPAAAAASKPSAPAKKAPARKAAAQKAPAKKSAKPAAKKPAKAAKKAAKKVAKKAPAKKAAAKKKAAPPKKAAKKAKKRR